MDFILSKVVLLSLLPPASILIMLIAGFLLLTVFRRTGKVLIFIAFFMLYLFSIEPISDAIIRPLEQDIPILGGDMSNYSAIVVLSGGVHDMSWLGLNPEPSDASLKRIVYAIKLYKELIIPLVITGGSGNPAKPNISEADAMAQVALYMGVPATDIVIENKSRNTHENVKALDAIWKRDRHIILVTSAFHMKRSMAMFKRLGFEPIPAPCDYKSEQNKLTFYSFIPHAGNLQISATALYEYMSFIWYKTNRVI